MRRLFVLLALLASAFAAAGCNEAVRSCQSRLDCTDGAACVSGQCKACPASCAATEICLEGECRPKACGDRPCRKDEACVSNTCRAADCAAVTCPSGQGCAKGECYPVECGSAGTCILGDVCYQKTCEEPTCVGKTCTSTETCAGGQCLPTVCAGVVCAPGNACEDGRCVSTRCVGVVCASGLTCSEGACVSTDCQGVSCAPGEGCVAGACVDTGCIGRSCPVGQSCAKGQCLPNSCDGRPCPGGEVCQGGGCITIRCVDVSCSGATTCVDGQCVAEPPDAGEAPDASEEPDGGGRPDAGGTPDAAGPVVQVREGTPAVSATVCPGARDQKLGSFSLATDTGTGWVTGVTVTVGGYQALTELGVYDETGAVQYFKTAGPISADTVDLSGGAPIPVSTTRTYFKILASYKAEPAPPPAGTTATTAHVSALVTDLGQAGDDGAEATLTLDNQAPANTSVFATSAGDGTATLSWTLSSPEDTAMVVRYASNTDVSAAVDGKAVTVGDMFGVGGTVRYVGSGGTFTDTGLTNGATYNYRIFERDGCLNHSPGTWSAALTPVVAGTTTLGNGIAGTTVTACPGSAGLKIDGFSLVTAGNTAPVTGLTVDLSTTGHTAIQTASVWNEAGTTQYFATITRPSSMVLTFSGGTPIPASATTANFKVLVTLRSEVQSPPAGLTLVTGRVSSLTTANAVMGSDTADALVTLDNEGPSPGASWNASSWAGDGQNYLSWTLGTAGDEVLVVRYENGTIDTAMPTDGVAYSSGAFGNGGTVVTSGSAANVWDTSVVNGTSYTYRVFERDACKNYVASGAAAPWTAAMVPGPTTALGQGIAATSGTVCPGSTGKKLGGFSMWNSATGATTPVTGLVVELTGYQAIKGAAIWNEAGTTQYFTSLGAPSSNTLTFAGGSPLPLTTAVSNFKVVVSYWPEDSAPAGATLTTARVASFTTANANKNGMDAAEATLTLSNGPPDSASWNGVAPGSKQATLNWTLGYAADNVMIVRYSAKTDTTEPTDGTSYAVDDSFGVGGYVVFNGTGTLFVDTGLTAGATYYYRIFEYDSPCRNYASGPGAPWSNAVVPNP